MIDKTTAERIAQATHAYRPEWPIPSLMTFLARPEVRERPSRDVALALAYVAHDPQTVTPARVLEAGPWWSLTRPQDKPTVSVVVNDCPEHPGERAGRCEPCDAAATAVDHTAHAAQVKAELRAALDDARRTRARQQAQYDANRGEAK